MPAPDSAGALKRDQERPVFFAVKTVGGRRGSPRVAGNAATRSPVRAGIDTGAGVLLRFQATFFRNALRSALKSEGFSSWQKWPTSLYILISAPGIFSARN